MKKSLIIISALLLVFATALTACGNKNVIVDKNGRTYTPVTDKDGNKQQDKWGRLIIEQTDEDGIYIGGEYYLFGNEYCEKNAVVGAQYGNRKCRCKH